MTDTDRLPCQAHWIRTSLQGSVYYAPRCIFLRHLPQPSQAFPTPHIRPRQRRPHTIHITTYPPGYVPCDLRMGPYLERKKEEEQQKIEKARKRKEEKKSHKHRAQICKAVLEKLRSSVAAIHLASAPSSAAPTRPQSRSSALENTSTVPSTSSAPDADATMTRSSALVAATRPPAHTVPSQYRNSMMSVRSAKSTISQLVTEIPNKPVASASGVACSIILAEPNVFLAGFDHDVTNRQENPTGTALLRGKLQLRVTKNIKLKSIELKLVGKARTEWPEGIPPIKAETYEEESLRTQVLTFFNAMYDTWASEYGNQCTYTLKSVEPNNSSNTNLGLTPRSSMSMSPAGSMLSVPTRQHNMTAKELKRLSLQSVQSRSFGKGENPLAAGTPSKGYKVFYPGVYEYSFELPIDHHQLETAKLQYGSVKWELQATVERAGAFKPNLHGTKEVSIVRVPDQLSLETVEPISISRRWEDQLHYDIIISGKSFPIGTKIPIAFKLTPLAKVQVHKLKVYVTETIEYWTNDRRVTRKDPGRKILLLEKTAGRPLEPLFANSELRVLSGGELTPEQRREAREVAMRRRSAEASRHNTAPRALPEPTANLLGDLDLGLEHYWGATEIEMNVQLPTCETMAKNKEMRLHPDCSWKNVNVYHWIKLVMRLSRVDPEDPTGQRRRHFEISIDSPFTILNCRATQANTSLPEYAPPTSCLGRSRATACGCHDALTVGGGLNLGTPNASTPSLASTSTTDILATVGSQLPAPPQAAHLHSTSGEDGSPPTSQHGLGAAVDSDAYSRPIHLLRVPSYNPPAFDAEPPPPAIDANIMTPPPQYDVIVGTPSVDGMADYFQRLADYGFGGSGAGVAGPRPSTALGLAVLSGSNEAVVADDDEDSSSTDEEPARAMTRSGRVNVANPRTPGGRRAPSRSMDIERPMLNLSLEALQSARVGEQTASVS